MSSTELIKFMTKYQMDRDRLAELIGLTPVAIEHWMFERRSIAKPYGRLLRLFDRRPELMKEFK